VRLTHTPSLIRLYDRGAEVSKMHYRDEVPHLSLITGAGVTPAEGSVKPTAGFTLNQVYFPKLGICSYSIW
jgi:hypothetical protein